MLIISRQRLRRSAEKKVPSCYFSLSRTQLSGAEIKNICMKNLQRARVRERRIDVFSPGATFAALSVLFNEKQARRSQNRSQKRKILNWGEKLREMLLIVGRKRIDCAQRS
jgi:hypothetical protein